MPSGKTAKDVPFKAVCKNSTHNLLPKKYMILHIKIFTLKIKTKNFRESPLRNMYFPINLSNQVTTTVRSYSKGAILLKIISLGGSWFLAAFFQTTS